jgi:hypothetical protein
MKLPKAAHISQGWRVDEIVPDFRLEDVWALPTPGGPNDFSLLMQGLASADPEQELPLAARTLFRLRCRTARSASTYMAAIKPFRRRIVYPQMMRVLDRRWSER